MDPVCSEVVDVASSNDLSTAMASPSPCTRGSCAWPLRFLTLALTLAAMAAERHLQPGAPHFKKGSGGGGLCGDLDPGPGGLGNVTWWYDWGHSRNGFRTCNGSSPKSAEYTPMIWGKWALGNATAAIADLRANAPDARYIFGFNEPDHSGSYLKPQDGAARWAAMEYIADTLNLTLVAPCVSNYDSGNWWLATFSEAFRNATGRT